MKVEYGSITITSTGTDTLVLDDFTLTPTKIVMWVASSATETSAGFSDLTTKFTGGSAYADENLTKALTHYRNISGIKTKVFETDVTGFSTGEVAINTTTCTQATKVNLVVYGS